MSHQKWNVQEIEEIRLSLSDLQKQSQEYIGIKKLVQALCKAILNALKYKFNRASSIPENEKVSQVDFFALNPDFQPYQIKLKKVTDKITPKKILHVIPYFITGGSQQLVVDIIEGLSDEYEHEVALMTKHVEQGYVGVPTHNCTSTLSSEGFAALLVRLKPTIIHVHYYGRWPAIFWHWYHAVFQGAFTYGCPVVENCNIPYMPYFHAGITRYVYVSEYARDTYGVRAMPNQVIYPGSNFSFFQRAGTQPDPDTIGMVYRLDHDKLNEQAIEPFIRTVQKRPRTKVLIVGGGQYLELFQQKVAAAGVQAQFVFTGYVAYEKLAALYQQMAVFVAPVYSESFGQVTPFAMNMGIPVAAYNIGALEEMLANPEVLAPGDDAEALSDIIVKLLDDPARRAQIGAFNQARATEFFSVETMVEAYRQVYQSLH